MGVQYFLLDFENVQPTSLGSLKPGSCKIKIFLGQNQSKLPLDLSRALQPFGADVEFIQISGNGPNAVDFHIAFCIGKLSSAQPDASYTIVSKDTGFDPLIKYLKASGITCHRVATIGGVAKVAAVAKSATKPKPPIAKNSVTPKPKPAKNVVVTILPSANGAPVEPNSGAAASSTRVAEIIQRLQGLKAAKPAKLKTLQSSMRSWFKPALDTKELAALIQGLVDARKIKVDGTKVTYFLG